MTEPSREQAGRASRVETQPTREAEDNVNEQASDVRLFVIFIAGGEVFAVDMAPVQEIIRVPAVVRVPLASSALDGLANLRGKVLPIISLRRIFGFEEREHDEASRALVIDLGHPLGFVVDKVVSVVSVDSSKLEGVGAIRSTVNTDLLLGLIKDVAGHAVIMVLDFAKLIAQEFAEVAAVAKESALSAGFASDGESEEEAVSDELHLVSFDVAGQEYAIGIEDVQEIVQVPENIVHVPHSESHVLGVMTLRNRLLPLVSLRRMFALEPQAADEHCRIVVVSLGASSVGIVMDSVNEVLRVPASAVDAMPPLCARDGEPSDISQICRLDGGKRLVSIISAANLFRHSAVKEALSRAEGATPQQANEERATEEEADSDDEQVVVLRLGQEEFGVPIESVQEIVRVPEQLTHVPKAPAFVEGVINLRGAVLPVIDLRRRLGLSAAEHSDRQRIMVFLVDGIRTGFIVDSVAEVLKIHKSNIEPAPRLSSAQGKLLARMANLQKQSRMVQLIAPLYLIEDGERAALAEMPAA